MKDVTLKALMTAALTGGSVFAQCNPQLTPAPTSYTFSSGVNGDILCSIEWDPDGTTGPKLSRLVVGGTFTTAEGGTYNHIAMFNGTNWEPLWTGMNGDVLSLSVDTSDNSLLAAGKFTSAGGVTANKLARYSDVTQRWTAIGTGVSGAAQVNAIQYDPVRDDIYIGGNFTAAGGVNTGALARIHGTTYSTVGGIFSGTINTFCYDPDNSDIYIGGQFTGIGNSPNVARLSVLTLGLVGVGTGLPGGGVNCFARYSESGPLTIVAGGSFGTINNVQFNSIARLQAGSWVPMNGGVAGTVQGLCEYDGDLIATGGFTLSMSGVVNRVTRWNGQVWAPMDSGFNGLGYTLNRFRGALYAGGQFTQAGSATVSRFAMWDRTSWGAPRATPSGKVLALLSSGSSLIIGGLFDMSTSAGISAHNVVRYSAAGYSAYENLGGFNGVNGRVNALNLKPSGIGQPAALYVGGTFTTAGGNPASNIAVWSGFEWSPVNEGVNGTVNGIATYGCTGTINQTCGTVVTGSFTMSGATATSNIARFGPGAVSRNLGTGLNNAGYCLMNYGTDLLVGGAFTVAGGLSAPYLAQWNGTTWSKFNNTTLNGAVRAMTMFNGDLIIAGDFTTINGIEMRSVARWNGTSWFRMDTGLPAPSGGVVSLVAHDGKLFAGGGFVNTLGTATTLARWDGGAWEPVSIEPNGVVSALASVNGTLWAGGLFTFVNNKYSPFLASSACACYANCDNSTGAPILNVNDFQCFLNQFAVGSIYANCDGSTGAPILNVNDFQCFLNKFAIGCQ